MRIFRCLLAILVFPAGACFAAEPLAKGRIVILSGLPGDVESDTLYKRRLSDLLEVLGNAGVKPESVHLFAHDPDKIQLPAGWRGMDVRPASRQGFLELGETLGSASDPVSLLAWGHGGSMRDKAVFHVAGPRITGEDFAAFAASVGKNGAPVRGILFFTGSGDIVRAMRDAGGEFLCSENTVRFQNDPIGWEVVLDAWKKNPGADLESLARAAGPRIAGWYAGRGLARTEEPVYLAKEAGPLLLADLQPAVAGASPTPAADVSGHWKKLTRANPVDFPGSNAVVLERSQSYTLGESPAISAEIEEYIQILTPEGKEHGDFQISFSPPEEDIEFLALEVLGPDGKARALETDDVFEKEKTDEMGYRREGGKFFSLPGVQAGAILHTKFRRTWKRFPFPHVFLDLPVADEIPVLRSTIRVEAPRRDAFHYHLDGLAAQKPQAGETAYGQSYSWEWKNIPAFAREALAGPGGVPSLQVSTFPDWKTFTDWYRRLIREADGVTDEIRAKTAEVTAGLKTPEEKVKALYEFVTAMRYVSVPLGVNSHRPHAAANVLRNNYGDCKDKANLLNTMLKAAGIEASLVLVPRFSQADEAVPGLSFNHAISRVELPSGPMWLDATDDVCPFGMLPPGDAGRNALVVNATPEKLQALPRANAADHAIEIEFRIDPSGKTPDEEIVRAKGFGSYLLREAARKAATTGGTLTLLDAARLTAPGGIFVADEAVRTPVGALEKPFESSTRGRWTGVVSSLRSEKFIQPPFVLPLEWRSALQPRKQALFLNGGYPMTLRETVRIRLDGSAELPAPAAARDSVLQWSVTWKNENGEAVGNLNLVLPDAEIPPDLVPRFQKELARLYEALMSPVVLGAKAGAPKA